MDLSAILGGSRVTVLGLTPPVPAPLDPWRQLMDSLLPSVYRAYAQLGQATAPLPTVVAPLGVTSDKNALWFWESFYNTLAEKRSVEVAMEATLQRNTALPFGLFLRHRLGQEFIDPVGDASDNPSLLAAQVSARDELLEQLRAIAAAYGTSAVFEQEIAPEQHKQEERRQALRGYLEPDIQKPK